MNIKRKKILTALCIALFIVAMLVATVLLIEPIKRLASEPESIRAWVEARGVWGRVAFIGIIIVQLIVAVIPGEPLEIAAGYAFGAFWGTALCLIGALFGSAIVFLFVRKFGVKALEVFFPREKIDSIKFLSDAKRLNMLVFIVFLIPGTPKDILCYGVGLTKMRFSTWMLITSVARIPSIVTSTIGGNALGTGDFAFAVIVFAVTIALSAIGLLAYNRISASRARVDRNSGAQKTARMKTREEKKQARARAHARAKAAREATGPRAWREKARMRGSESINTDA